ncbi:hypothetical protein GCM10009765_23640 [Fodinicola feengrottensis]|uniref:Uncharacterized protein n=1 Tax=Fodinicola feengrottensis TaxID=435914 RepID=A0ABP4SL34_9ACTN
MSYLTESQIESTPPFPPLRVHRIQPIPTNHAFTVTRQFGAVRLEFLPGTDRSVIFEMDNGKNQALIVTLLVADFLSRGIAIGSLLDIAAAIINDQIDIIREEVEHEVRCHDADDFSERAAILQDIAGDITAALNRLQAVAEDDRAPLAEFPINTNNQGCAAAAPEPKSEGI